MTLFFLDFSRFFLLIFPVFLRPRFSPFSNAVDSRRRRHHGAAVVSAVVVVIFIVVVVVGADASVVVGAEASVFIIVVIDASEKADGSIE